MSEATRPNESSEAADRLMALLDTGMDSTALTWRLFEINFERALASDPALAFALRACAIPAQFDAEVIGALCGAPEASEENERLLAALQTYSFVQRLPEGGYAYHDTTREAVLRDWQREERLPELEAVRQRLAEFYLERGKARSERDDYTGAKEYELAIGEITRAIKLNPHDGDNFRWRGRAYRDQGQYELALTDLDRAIRLQPENGYNYQSRGIAYLNQSQYELALADLNRAIELQPDNGYNYHWRACIRSGRV